MGPVEELGIGRQQCEQLPPACRQQLITAAWADGPLTAAEETDLPSAARLLGLPQEVVDTGLAGPAPTARSDACNRSSAPRPAHRSSATTCGSAPCSPPPRSRARSSSPTSVSTTSAHASTAGVRPQLVDRAVVNDGGPADLYADIEDAMGAAVLAA